MPIADTPPPPPVVERIEESEALGVEQLASAQGEDGRKLAREAMKAAEHWKSLPSRQLQGSGEHEVGDGEYRSVAPRKAGKIKVRYRYRGRGAPRILGDDE